MFAGHFDPKAFRRNRGFLAGSGAAGAAETNTVSFSTGAQVDLLKHVQSLRFSEVTQLENTTSDFRH